MPFVSNYKINVFNIAWLRKKQINMFKSDFKCIVEFLRSQRLKRQYTGSKEKLHHANETLKLFTALMGDDSFEKAYNEGNFERGGVTMCDVVERIRNDGIAEGKADIIKKMLDAKALTIEQIADILKLPVKEVQKIARKVPVMG